VFQKNKIFTFLCAFFGAVITWYIQHEMGYSAVIANGIVGVLAGVLLAPALAGATYTASFVGMSATNVLPTLGSAALAGVVVGIVIILTAEIYAGIGGKGGTTAAFSVHISRFIMSIFG
jgi:hypothetical protein